MDVNLSFLIAWWETIKRGFSRLPWPFLVVLPAVTTAVVSTVFYLMTDALIAYGDTESHLNIAKRVVHSLTPGAAQLGGIWLPLPHIMMIPLVWFDPLWRSGLAGSIVSGICYVIAAVCLYKLGMLVIGNRWAAVLAALLFIFNPNVMYLQSTAMTELPLIAFFMLSSYFFIRYLKGIQPLFSLVVAAFFGFCAVLSRYDGWFLVMFEAMILGIQGIMQRWHWKKIEGMVIMFSTLAFFGILLWLLWGQLILGNALYFTQSEFSAKTQQMSWLAKGELPGYHNLWLSVLYYFVTSMSNAGILIYFLACIGAIAYLRKGTGRIRFLIAALLLVPFIFYVVTMYIGQSVIFIPHVTPVSFEWRLFNVRYGAMMIPVVAFFTAFLFSRVKRFGKLMILLVCMMQLGLYGIGYSKVISYADGIEGLSHAKRPDAEVWMKEHYDGGLVLMDDYARTMSVVRSGIPMQNIIYIGNKPYWEESLQTPEKHARWVVMQEDDAVWDRLFADEAAQGRLYAAYEKVYTSPEILIFRRQE